MSQSTMSSEVNKRVCEVFGCFAEATINIKVEVGQRRKITLELCKDCVKQFQDN
jgi:hypothetical protein